MSKYYGVSQSTYGHEYRFIFTKEAIESAIGSFPENESTDCFFPFGGSNCSATTFEPIENDKDAKTFLLRPAKGPDMEDPTLIDIAEYLLTIYTDSDSNTQEFLDRLRLDAKDLEQYDDEFNHLAKSEKMIAELLDSGTDFDDVIDRENPFYGFSSNLRFSTLCDIYDEYVKEELEKE